jgi:tetratricopeptide (TPR) repeat protein
MPTVVVLHGMGGCGKSQLALEYCQQSENDNSYSAIFWVDATSPAIIEQGINDLARQLSKPGFDIVDVEGNIHFVLSKLSTWPSSWLLVFDNFDDPHSFKDKSIKQYFPRSNKGSILVTSRDATARSLGYYIDASTMANEEALDLLFKRSETPRNDANLPDARRIVKRLKFHALAIDQAGAYILARSLDFGLFLEHYNKRRRQVLEETPSLWDYSRKLKLGQESETQLSVFTTWELSFNLITGDKKARGDKEHILTLFAFFDANEMADSLLEPYYSENDSWMASCTSDNAWDEYKFQDILKELRNLSLVQGLRIQKSGAIFALHPLVQDWAKLRICPECRKAYTVEATLVLENFIKANKFHEMAFNKRQTTFSHVESVVQNRVEYLRPEDHAQNASVLNATVIFVGSLESLGQYKVAEELCRHELEEIKDLFGKESPHTLSTLNGLAFILNSQGKYDEAEPMSQQTVALREKVSGKKHPETLTTMNNLAVLLQNQGKYDEAELIYRQTLALREKVLGREHPDTVLIRRALDGCLESRCNQSSAPQEESDVTR